MRLSGIEKLCIAVEGHVWLRQASSLTLGHVINQPLEVDDDFEAISPQIPSKGTVARHVILEGMQRARQR